MLLGPSEPSHTTRRRHVPIAEIDVMLGWHVETIAGKLNPIDVNRCFPPAFRER